MRVVWTDTARAELASQVRYIAERNRDAARRQQIMVQAAVRRLRDFPRMGRPGTIDGTRELPITGTPYIAIYEEFNDKLVIVHVYHGRQDWQAGNE